MRYSITNGNADRKFDIDAVSGQVTLIQEVDFDDAGSSNSYTLTIAARDNAGISPYNEETTTLIVTILDVNDNTPSCSPALISVDILESIGNSVQIATLTCTDEDSGTNQDLEYSLLSIDGNAISTAFQVDNSGKVSTGSAVTYDFETKTAYKVLIHVKDKGSPSLSFTATVNVAITDVNEGGPVFKGTPYSTNVDENSAVGSTVFRVSAVDNDTEDTVTYLINPSNAYFEIDPVSGEIYTIAAIDFDTLSTAVITLQVIASDGTYEANETVTLTVINKNDGIPVFNPGVYAVSIPENTTVSTTIVTVSVFDIDDSMMTFSIFSGNIGNCFSISNDNMEGHIYLADVSNFDYDNKEKSYSLIVRAEDGGGAHTASTTVVIEVTNINESPPVFAQTDETVFFLENSALGTSIDMVNATDADDGVDGEVTYTIASITNNGNGKFTVDPTSGLVELTGSLDRETQSTYMIEIFATDGGQIPCKFCYFFCRIFIMKGQCFSIFCRYCFCIVVLYNAIIHKML